MLKWKKNHILWSLIFHAKNSWHDKYTSKWKKGINLERLNGEGSLILFSCLIEFRKFWKFYHIYKIFNFGEIWPIFSSHSNIHLANLYRAASSRIIKETIPLNLELNSISNNDNCWVCGRVNSYYCVLKRIIFNLFYCPWLNFCKIKRIYLLFPRV